jgi:hypothetical protein
MRRAKIVERDRRLDERGEARATRNRALEILERSISRDIERFSARLLLAFNPLQGSD